MKRVLTILLCSTLLLGVAGCENKIEETETEDKDTEQEKDYIISDETENCDSMLEEIARDEEYIYYLSCIKSETIFLKYNDGEKTTLKLALNDKKTTISELIEKGLEVTKRPFENDEEIAGLEESKIKYTITFNSDGGSKVSNQTIEEGIKVTTPKNPTKKDYTFVEWQLDGKKYDFNKVITKNITLKALWKKNETSNNSSNTIIPKENNSNKSENNDDENFSILPLDPDKNIIINHNYRFGIRYCTLNSFGKIGVCNDMYPKNISLTGNNLYTQTLPSHLNINLIGTYASIRKAGDMTYREACEALGGINWNPSKGNKFTCGDTYYIEEKMSGNRYSVKAEDILPKYLIINFIVVNS